MSETQCLDFAEIADALHAEPDVDHTLESMVALARDTIGGDLAGVMLIHRGRRVDTAAVTDPQVEELDRLQFETGGGPCLSAIDTEDDADTSCVIRDTETESRWRPWCEAVSRAGIRSVLSVRLFTSHGTIGALNLYSRTPDTFEQDDVDVAEVFVRHASLAVAAAQTESGLREAIDGRHLIGLAQGILMERFALDKDQAFSVLRRYSQDRNTKLRTVAAQIVETRKLPA